MKKIIFLLILVASTLATNYLLSSKKFHTNFISSLIAKKNIQSRVNTLDYNPTNLVLAVGYENGDIDVYDASKDSFSLNIKAHQYRVSHLTTNRKGHLLASSSNLENVTYIWDLSNGEKKLAINNTRGPEIFSHDSNFIYMADNSTIKIFNLLNNSFFPVKYESNGVIHSLTLSANEKYIAVGTTGKIQVWEIKTNYEEISFWERLLGHKNVSLELLNLKTLYKPWDWINLVKFTKDNSKLVSVSKFGNIDIHEAPFLTGRISSNAKLKHINSMKYHDEEETLYLAGTKKSIGLRKGFVESVSLRTNTSKILKSVSSNLPTLTTIKQAKVVLIANSRKFSALKLQN